MLGRQKRLFRNSLSRVFVAFKGSNSQLCSGGALWVEWGNPKSIEPPGHQPPKHDRRQLCVTKGLQDGLWCCRQALCWLWASLSTPGCETALCPKPQTAALCKLCPKPPPWHRAGPPTCLSGSWASRRDRAEPTYQH